MAGRLLFGRPVRLQDTVLPTLATLTLAAAPALADAPAAVDLAPAPSAPTFPSLGPDGADRSFHARISALTADDADDPLWGLDLGGQAIGRSGWGGYGALRVAHADDETSIGAPELGVLYRATGDAATTTFRAGLSIGRELDDDDDAFGRAFLGVIDTGLRRPSDLIRALPETTALRFAIAPTVRSGATFLRADVGVDLPVDDQSDEDFMIAHADLGVGVRSGPAAFVGELQNAFVIGDGEDEAIHAAAASVEYVGEAATVSFTLSRGFGWEIADELEATGFEIGVRGTL